MYEVTRWMTGAAVALGILLGVGGVAAQGGGTVGHTGPAPGAGFDVRAPQPWIQEDPGTKAYTAAREALNARRYEDAVRAFEALRAQYPNSGYVSDSYYYEAFALSQEGTRASMRRAVALLETQRKAFPDAATSQDAAVLRVRIEGQLARRGDAASAAAIQRQASQPCMGDQDARLAALGALLQMNASKAVPILQEVLKDRDQCSVELRRRAVFLLAQKMNDSSVNILLDLAVRNPDPDPEVRREAVFWLSQVHTPAALAALQSVLADSADPNLQQTAVFALSQQRSDSAVRVLRRFAEQPDAPKDLREKAIFWIGQDAKAGGAPYLMNLYERLHDQGLKERVIYAIAQAGGDEARSWLLARAADPRGSTELRKEALFWGARSQPLATDELQKLYTSFHNPILKEQVVFVASQQDDQAAVDFLMDVARNAKEKKLRDRAIFWLGQSKDPRVPAFLLGLIKK